MDRSLPEGSDLFTGLFIGNKGVCYGFSYGGDFFKNEDIKKRIENRTFFKEFKEGMPLKGGHGFKKFYKYSELIEVDIEKGVFYCGQLKENIITPEGENYRDYFGTRKKLY